MTSHSISSRHSKSAKARPRQVKHPRTTLGSDVYCDGKRVTGGPTVYELLEMREKQRKLAASSSPTRVNGNGKHTGKKNGARRRREK